MITHFQNARLIDPEGQTDEIGSLTIRDGRRVTVAQAWLTHAVRARKNLTILAGHLVRRLKLDGDRVAGLEAVGPQGPVEIFADAIILSAGALESPALLMQ